MRSRSSSFVGQLALVLGLLSAPLEDARADVGPLHYSVDPRAKGCPSSAEFLRDVERQMGRDDEPPHVDHRPRVDVRIEADARELRAYVEVDAEGPEESHGPEPTAEGRLRKTLRAPAHACGDLASAVAIVVSLMFRTSAERHAPHASSPPSPAPPVEQEPASRSDVSVIAQPDIVLPGSSRVPPVPPAPRAPSSPTSLRHAVYAGAIVGKTLVPEVGVGALVGYGVTWRGERRRLSFGLATEASSTGARTAMARRGGGVLVHSNGLSVGPCLYLGRLLSCTAVTLGSTTGVGTGVREPERRAFLLVEAAVRFGARIPLPPPFALRTDLRVGAPVTRPRFFIESDRIWEAPAVTVLGSCALETTF